jgi:hypothetical protein
VTLAPVQITVPSRESLYPVAPDTWVQLKSTLLQPGVAVRFGAEGPAVGVADFEEEKGPSPQLLYALTLYEYCAPPVRFWSR